jgi:type II secretory pathway pseudopilin PulG
MCQARPTMLRHSNKPRLLRGMTFVEVVVVIALMGIVGMSLMGAIRYFYRTNAYVLEQTASVDNSRRAITTTLQNLREMTYGDDGSYPLNSAATSTVTFFADVDGDPGVERVRAYVQDGTMYRGITNAAGSPAVYTEQTEQIATIITNIRNAENEPLFRYFDENGTELAVPINLANVASVRMQVKIDLNPTRAPNVYTLGGSATLRTILIQ